MSDNEINADKIREQTEKLIELLREYHPEQECEPEGLRIKEEPVKAMPPAPPPVMPTRARLNVPQTMRKVVLEVAAKHDIEPEMIMSRKRSRHLVDARSEIYARMRDLQWSWHRIGLAVKRDHSTIIHNVRNYNRAQAAMQ